MWEMLLYNLNGTTRMRSNTNSTNLGWNNILLRLQICIHMYMWDSKMAEVIFNQSGAELRIQDGGANKSATMLENSIEEDLGSISMAPTSKSIQCLAVLNGCCEVTYQNVWYDEWK